MTNPYAPLTDSTETIANYFLTVLTNNMSTFTDNGNPPTAIQAVWYGDPAGLIPTTPALAVIPGPESSVYNGVGGRPVLMSFQTFIMVYYGKIQDIQINVHASLTIANKIKRFMNADIDLGHNVIDSMCSVIDPGISFRGSGPAGALYDTTRMTFVSRSKTTLNA